MDAKQFSTTNSDRGKLTAQFKYAVQFTSGLANWTGRFLAGKAMPWCRDHSVSIVVLLVFPLAIGAYYWMNPDPTPDSPPKYLLVDESRKATEQLPFENNKNPVVSVVPDYSSRKMDAAALRFPGIAAPPTLSVPEPVFAPVESPRGFAEIHAEPTMKWDFQDSSTPQRASQCVWLTGTIENLEPNPEPIQNATRVHNLTNPNRN